LVLAQEAASQLGLDEVLLVPAGEAPHKRIEPEPGKSVRLEMTRLAAQEDELVSASEVEVTREGPSYTYRTLELLAEERPEDERWFLMGADVAASIETWREPMRVLELAGLGVAARAGTVLDEVEAALERLGAGRHEVIRMPEIGVSSTWVRRRVAQGRPVRYLVPDAVVDFIAERGLYRG
jgi:nicotinate-nucleotide adenylyltransferase